LHFSGLLSPAPTLELHQEVRHPRAPLSSTESIPPADEFASRESCSGTRRRVNTQHWGGCCTWPAGRSDGGNVAGVSHRTQRRDVSRARARQSGQQGDNREDEREETVAQGESTKKGEKGERKRIGERKRGREKAPHALPGRDSAICRSGLSVRL